MLVNRKLFEETIMYCCVCSDAVVSILSALADLMLLVVARVQLWLILCCCLLLVRSIADGLEEEGVSTDTSTYKFSLIMADSWDYSITHHEGALTRSAGIANSVRVRSFIVYRECVPLIVCDLCVVGFSYGINNQLWISLVVKHVTVYDLLI